MHEILSENFFRILIRIFRLTFCSVFWLYSFSSGVSFVLLLLAFTLSYCWFSLALWPSLSVCLYLRLMGSFRVGGVDFLCWAQVGQLQGLAEGCRARGEGEEKGQNGKGGCVATPSAIRAAFWGVRSPCWFSLSSWCHFLWFRVCLGK